MPIPNYIDKVFTNFTKGNFGYSNYAVRSSIPLAFNIFTPVSDTGTPVGEEKKPLVVTQHGAAGKYDEPLIEGWAEEWIDRGYAAASIQYTLGKTFYGTDRERADKENTINLLTFIRFATLNADAFGIDANRIITFGISFGGINSIHGNVAQFSMSDPYFIDPMNSLYAGSANKIICSSSVSGACYDYILQFLTANASQHHDHHGDLDMTVPYTQAVKTNNEMNALSIPSTLTTYKGKAHSIGQKPKIADLLSKKYAPLILA